MGFHLSDNSDVTKMSAKQCFEIVPWKNLCKKQNKPLYNTVQPLQYGTYTSTIYWCVEMNV